MRGVDASEETKMEDREKDFELAVERVELCDQTISRNKINTSFRLTEILGG
jgi:hypothetical protein